MTGGEFQAEFTRLANEGFRLVDLSGYEVGGQDRYATFWESRGFPLDELDAMAAEIRAFMATYSVPGAALAIAKDGKLVYAQGFGQADPASGEPVTVNSLFRIGSVSKTITAVTIMQLVQQGRLSLSERIFGDGGVLGGLAERNLSARVERAQQGQHLALSRPVLRLGQPRRGRMRWSRLLKGVPGEAELPHSGADCATLQILAAPIWQHCRLSGRRIEPLAVGAAGPAGEFGAAETAELARRFAIGHAPRTRCSKRIESAPVS